MGRKKVLGEESKAISVRITKKQKASIKLLVKQGKYADISDFVRHSINAYLGIQGEIIKDPDASGGYDWA